MREKTFKKDKQKGSSASRMPKTLTTGEIDGSKILGTNGQQVNVELMNEMTPYISTPNLPAIDPGQIVRMASADVEIGKSLAHTFNIEAELPSVQSIFLNKGDISTVTHISELPVVVSIPRLDAPFYVPRAVKMYVEFYNFVTKYFMDNVARNLERITPTSIQNTFGTLVAKEIGDQMLVALSGDRTRNQKNIFAVGEYTKENILYDMFTKCISGSPTPERVMEAIFWILLYHINKKKDMAQHDELVISEGIDNVCTLYTAFNEDLMSEIDTRVQNFKHPQSVYDFIFNINEKIVNESNLLSGAIAKSRQSDIQMEFPYLTERYVTYLFVNLFIQHQDTIYAGVTAQMLRIRTLLDNVTVLLKNNKAFEIEEWIHTLAAYDVLVKDYKQTSMTGGSITSEIVDMYEKLKKTDMVFELAAIIHEARISTGDVDTREPVKPETFRYIIDKVRPRLDLGISELITKLALAQQWLALNIDHIPGMNTVTLSELGIQMIDIATLSKVMVTPVIAIENRKMTSNEQTVTRYTIELPHDAYVRFKINRNAALKNVSFLTRSKKDTTNIDAVLLQSQIAEKTSIPAGFELKLDDQYSALESDMLGILYDHKMVLAGDSSTGCVISDEAKKIITDQKNIASDILRIHEIWRNNQASGLTARERTKLFERDIIDRYVDETSDDGSEFNGNSTFEVINELTLKFSKLQYMGDNNTFYAPLAYSADHLFSHTFMNIILKGFEHLYVSTKTGEMLYPVIAHKEQVEHLPAAMLFIVHLDPVEVKALVPSCCIDKIPVSTIFLPHTRIGVSFTNTVPSMLRESSGINFTRYGKIDNTLPSFVWTTLRNSTVERLIRTGQMEINPISMSTKEYYRLDFIGDELYWQRQTIKNLLALYCNDLQPGKKNEEQDRLTQLLMTHIVRVFQQIPAEWLTGPTRSHMMAYTRYGYLSEQYRYQQRLSKDLLSHLPSDKSLLRRLIFVFLMNIYGYGMTLNAISNFSNSGDLALLNLPVCEPALNAYQRLTQEDVTIRTIIEALLLNTELIERTLSQDEDAQNLL